MGDITQLTASDESQALFVISPNKRLMAYLSALFDSGGNRIQEELVLVTADGQRQKAIPWEDGWVAMPCWLDNEHLAINVAGLNPDESASPKPAKMLILNPFTGERQILLPDFPSYLDTPSTELPWWDGWSGVIYDPQIKLAIYPRFLEEDGERFTHAIWDLSKGQLVTDLADIFTYYSIFNSLYPMPLWSPDGTHFIL